MAELVMELAGVDRPTAEAALAEHKEVWLAVGALMETPTLASDKYLPPKPKVSMDLTSEQKELCDRGRWLQDRINAVFSVAHSKTLPPPDDLPTVPELEEPPSVEIPTVAVAVESIVSQLDSPEQSSLPDSKSS